MAYLGKTPSQAVRSRYYFTASGGETSLSGTDDNSNTLTFTDGNYVDVSLNGVALVAGTDYNTTTANTIGGLTALVASDVVEVVVYDTFSVFSGEFRGDISLGDNVKAKFGASDDLQIYHDGSNSYINESGTGNLFIDAANYLTLRNTNGESYVAAQANGYVQLFYNGSQKLATTSTGADITGTLTADGLTVDGDGKISSTAPKLFLTETDTVDVNTRITSTGGVLYFQSSNDAENAHITRQTIDHSTGDISFYEDTGTTAKFFWDASAESLGIGTSSPANGKLVVESNGSNLYLKQTTGDYGHVIGQNDADGALTFSRRDGGNTERMRIDASGAVVINNSGGDAQLYLGGTSGTSRMYLARSGSDSLLWNVSNGNMRFGTNNAEAMRIDSSGNLLVGTTGSLLAGARVRASSIAATFEGEVTHAGGSGAVLWANRTSSDGWVAAWYRGGSSVGSISVTTTATAYNTSSDYRLKTDAQPMTGATDRLKQLNPVNFEWIADGTRVDGFLAHEAQAVVPEAVTGTHNEVDDDGNAVMQGIDQSKLVPLLTAALKEAITKIETLETEMTSVKARLDALEAN